MGRKTIYVTRQGAKVQRVDGQLGICIDRTVMERFSPNEIDQVLLFGNVQVSTQAIALLFRQGVRASFFSTSGTYRGQLVSPESGNVFVRLAQHARYLDPTFRLHLSRDLIGRKLGASRAMVRRFARNHPNLAEPMDACGLFLGSAIDSLETAHDCDALRGIEGASAARYFRAFDLMVQPPFRFERRSKHPAHNEVNALLNLGYTLLTGEIAGKLEHAGFDPRVGFYHGVRCGRSSLALDIIEPHRADVIDRLTLSILNRRMFTLNDFEDKRDAGIRLESNALRRYLELYEQAMGSALAEGNGPRALIEESVQALRRAVMAGNANIGIANADVGTTGSHGAEVGP